MRKKAVLYFVLFFSLCWMPLQAQDMEKAIRTMLQTYPETRLQDIYKSFYQDRFGPGHMISDSESSFLYLQKELQEPDEPLLQYEPTGAQSRFYRVHLKCVQDGLITAEELNNAFVRSANQVRKDTTDWKSEWYAIVATIDSLDLSIKHYGEDCTRIAEMLCLEGDRAVHHSPAFNEAYHPHYRLVSKEIFEKELLPQLIASRQEPFIEDNGMRYSSTTLIIIVDEEIGKEALLQAIEAYGAELKYNYRIIPGVAIRKPDDKTLEETMEYFKKVKGVISVERDGIMQLD